MPVRPTHSLHTTHYTHQDQASSHTKPKRAPYFEDIILGGIVASSDQRPVHSVHIAEIVILRQPDGAVHDGGQGTQAQVLQVRVVVHHQGERVAEARLAADHRQVGEQVPQGEQPERPVDEHVARDLAELWEAV